MAMARRNYLFVSSVLGEEVVIDGNTGWDASAVVRCVGVDIIAILISKILISWRHLNVNKFREWSDQQINLIVHVYLSS